MARLVYSGKRGREQSYELGDRTKVGRHPSCQLQLLDPTVSKEHFEIQAHDNSFWIRDLGSINGTWVNGVRLTDVRRLEHLDEIRMLHIKLLFSDAEAALRRSPTGDPYRKAARVAADALDAPRSRRGAASDKGDLPSLRRFYALVRMLSTQTSRWRLCKDAAFGLLSLCEADWSVLCWLDAEGHFSELARAVGDEQQGPPDATTGLFDITVRSRAPTFQLGQDGALQLVLPLLHAEQVRGVFWVGLDGPLATPAMVELLGTYSAFVAVALDALAAPELG